MMKLTNERTQNTETSYKIFLVILTILSLGLIIFAFFAPKLLVKEASSQTLDFTNTGNIGDTIGGLMNPFIALAGVMVTFLAFYIQYKFNEFQITEFRREIKLNEVKYDKDKFENQFYEMLRLHRDNVNELYIKIKKKTDEKIIEEVVYGRRVFEYLTLELSICCVVAYYSFKKDNLTPKELLNEAYGIFFHGFRKTDLEKHQFFKNIYNLQILIEKFDYEGFEKEIDANLKIDKESMISERIEFQIFSGYSHQLAHYYRHLFQTVKFVVQQDETLISYPQKRNYLRILRAQLSNSEQVLLFYNWYSDFGKQWEDKNNKFFTDYRMIHNLYNDILISQFKLEEIFDINSGYKKEPNRDSDNLFEFQDW